jgi:hypothetical protein
MNAGKALPADEAYAEVVLAKSWNDLMYRIAENTKVLTKA